MAAKSGCATYFYDRRWELVFSPMHTSTEVEVMGDVATRRRFSTWTTRPDLDGGYLASWRTEWEESGTEVGSHTPNQMIPPGPLSSVFPPANIEELLSECAIVLARDPGTHRLTFEFEPQYGVPTVCTYYPLNCSDQCEGGIRIARFACTPLPATGPNEAP